MPVETAGIKTTRCVTATMFLRRSPASQRRKSSCFLLLHSSPERQNEFIFQNRYISSGKQASLSSLHTDYICNKPAYPLSVRLSSTRSTAVRQVAIRPQLDDSSGSNAQVFRQRPPLSILPTRDLLRSLFISTISSNSFLLTPALHTLSFLCKPFGGRLLDVDRNPFLRKILKATFYNQFCAGENPTETKLCAQKLKDLGFEAIILTYGKESVHDDGANAATQGAGRDPEIDNWKVGIRETMNSVGPGDYIAFK